MKRWLIFLALIKCKLKPQFSILTPQSVWFKWKTLITSRSVDVEQWKHACFGCGRINQYNHFGKLSWQYLWKTQYVLALWPRNYNSWEYAQQKCHLCSPKDMTVYRSFIQNNLQMEIAPVSHQQEYG